MEHQEKICRLCLRKSHSDFNKNVDRNTKKFLNVVLLEINLDVSKEPTMCTNCAIVLQKCYDFKSTCLATREYTISFDNKDDGKLDLKDVYLSTNESKNVDCIDGDYSICCFCLGVIKNCSFVSLEQEDVKMMLEKCLPELDMSITKKPVVCVPCHGYLEDYFRFMTNCTIVEETIKKYCESEGTNSDGQIELINVVKFALKNFSTESETIKKENFIETNDQKLHVGEFQLENNFMIEGVKKFEIIKVEDKFCEPTEIAEVGNKHETVLKIEERNFNNRLQSNTLTCKEHEFSIKMEQKFWEDGETKVEPINECFTKLEDQKFLPCDYEGIDIKMDQSYDMPHTSIDRNVLEAETHQFPSCSYHTQEKSNLNLHMPVHGPSEVPIYKCESCSYQTKNKYHLTRHLLEHKEPSERATFKCDSCSYQTIHKNNLQKHLVVHRDPSEIMIHKCERCPYQTRKRCKLREHLLVHKDPSEITIYKCEYCSYQTRFNVYLRNHLLVHRNPSEVTMYKCQSCSFESKRKRGLKLHSIVHKSSSEIIMYQCDACSFQTKTKDNLRHHMLVHKDPSKITMYKCEHCPFETKRKKSLNVHNSTHKKTTY